MGMTQKPSNICLIRRFCPLHTPKLARHTHWNVEGCSFFFLVFMELWIMNLFHKDKI